MTPHEAAKMTANALEEISGFPLSDPARAWLLQWYGEGKNRAGEPRADLVADEVVVRDLCKRLRSESACGELLRAAVKLSGSKELRVSAVRALELPLSDPAETAATRLCNTDPAS